MTPACSTCARPAVVLLVHTLRIGRRVSQWRECRGCYLRAEREAAADLETRRI